MAPLPNSNWTFPSILPRSTAAVVDLPVKDNLTTIFARDNSTALFARDNSTGIFSRDNATAILARANATVLYARDNTTALFARDNTTALFARDNATALFARDNTTAIFARDNTTALFARENATAILARANSTLSSLVERSNTTLSPLVERANSTLASRSNLTLTGFARSVAPSGYSDASHPTVRMFSRAASTTYAPCAGCIDPKRINNKAFFALFAILGVVMVVVSIWFFFHAKNGGFKYEEGDWDDYKSTVLRRKGPDGKTIYSGTRSTVFNDKSDRIAAKSVIGYDEKGRKGIVATRGFGGTHSVYYSDNYTDRSGSRADDMSEVMTEKNGRHGRVRGGGGSSGHHSQRYRDRDLREYKHERPARVGGMNRAADGTQYDFSDRSETMTERSTVPLTNNKDAKHSKEHKLSKAEKRAQEDAARMERKWRKDAERAAAELARESARESTPKKDSTPKKISTPADKQAHRSRRDSRSRSSSPKKQQRSSRAYSFSGGQDEASSTVYSDTYTASTDRSTSYYDAYRPLAQPSPPPRQHGRHSSSHHSSASPSKHHRRYKDSDAGTSDSGARRERRRSKARGSRDVMAGYRRGMDSLASDSE